MWQDILVQNHLVVGVAKIIICDEANKKSWKCIDPIERQVLDIFLGIVLHCAAQAAKKLSQSTIIQNSPN